MILMQYTAFNVRFDVLDTPDCKNYSDNGVTLLCDTTCHLIDFLFEIDATINTYVLTYTQPVVESSSKKNVSRTSGFGKCSGEMGFWNYIYIFCFFEYFYSLRINKITQPLKLGLPGNSKMFFRNRFHLMIDGHQSRLWHNDDDERRRRQHCLLIIVKPSSTGYYYMICLS